MVDAPQSHATAIVHLDADRRPQQAFGYGWWSRKVFQMNFSTATRIDDQLKIAMLNPSGMGPERIEK
jgi:hypothetical protein